MSKERFFSRGPFRIILVLLVMLVGAVLLLQFRQNHPVRKQETMDEIYLPGHALYTDREERISVEIYFPRKDFEMQKESRVIFQSQDPVNRYRQVMILLLHGPRSDDLLPLFPEGVRLRELHFHEGCAYIDLRGPEKGSGMGCLMEHLAFMAIGKSLAANFSEVENVKFLLNGQERDTFFGHIDIRNRMKNY